MAIAKLGRTVVDGVSVTGLEVASRDQGSKGPQDRQRRRREEKAMVRLDGS